MGRGLIHQGLLMETEIINVLDQFGRYECTIIIKQEDEIIYRIDRSYNSSLINEEFLEQEKINVMNMYESSLVEEDE